MLNRLSSAVVPVTPDNLDPNRYSFLTLNNAEPNLGVSAGNNYVVISNTDGSRDLKQIGTLLTAGQGISIGANGLISLQPNINLDVDLANITRTGVTRFDYTPHTPTKLFRGNDINGNPLEFTSNDTVFVYIDGFLLQPNEDYTVAVGTGISNVTLTANSFSDSIVSIVRFSPTLFGQGSGGGGGNAVVSGTIYASNVIEDGNTTDGNIFFTNTRAVSALTAGQNIVIAANGLVSGLVTAFSGNTNLIPEGSSNLYYTNVRVLANLASNPTTIVGNLIPSATTGRNLGNSTHKWNMSAQVFSIGSIYLKDISGNLIITNNVNSTTTTSISTSFIPEGSNLYYSNARAVAAVKDNINTSNVIEGANLYFTNTRSVSSLTSGNNIVIEANGRISAVATLGGAIPQFYTPNIIEVGNTTTGNVYFTNTRAISALTAGIGIGISSTGNVSVSGLSTTNVSEGTNLYFTTGRARDSLTSGTGIAYEALTGTIALGAVSTDSVSEGSNLYFTNTRSVSSFTAGNNIVIEANGRISSSATISGLPTIYTSNIVESGNTTTGNVYFTNARARAAFTFAPGMYYNSSTGAVYANVVSVSGKTGQVILSANDIIESGNTTTGNVYFSNARARAAFTSGTGVTIDANGKISATLTGVSTGVIADIANTATLFTGNIIPAVAGKYDLGSPDMPWRDVYLTGATLSIGSLRLSQSASGGLSIVNSNTQQSSTPTFITDDVAEGPNLTSNLYFTNTRAIAAVRDNINTSNVLEGSNLYFTNTRAIYSLTAGTGIAISNTGTISTSVLNNGKFQGVIDASNVYENGNTTNGNVFFNNTRARAAFTGGNGIAIANGTITANVSSVNGKIGAILLYTGNIAESGNTTTGNVYFSNDRARAVFTAGDNISIAANGLISSTGGVQAADVGKNLANSGVTAGRYGTNTTVSAFIVGANGIISVASNIDIDFPVTKVNGLTGNITLNTANISENTNLYFTNARVRAAISAGDGISISNTGVISSNVISATNSTIRATLSVNNSNVAGANGYGNLSYDSANGTITYTRVSNADIKSALSAGNGIVIEANGQILSNLVPFTNARARAALTFNSSNVAGTKGYGNVSYDSANGIITYTRVSNVDIKDALIAGTGIAIAADGTISTSATAYTDTNARGSISTDNANIAGKTGYGNLTYNNLTGVITYTRVSNADIKSALSAGAGIAIEANGQILSTISATNSNVSGTNGYGNVVYDSANGIIKYTRVSNADIKSALSAGNGIVIEANGQILSTLTSFSNTNARGSISANSSNVTGTKGYGNLTYDSGTGVITYTRVSNVDIKDALSAGNGIAIDANGLITASATSFSNSGSRAAISVNSSNIAGTKGYGNLTYDSSTGVITYTRVSNADIKGALSAGNGIAIDANGMISTSVAAYVDANTRSAISVTSSNVANKLGYGNLTYDSSTGIITYTRVSNADIKGALSAGNGIAIDANGLITASATSFSNSGSRAAIGTNSSNVTGTKGYGNVSYDSSTGVITYTRVSNVDIKDALSAGTGIAIAANGMISTSVTSYVDANTRSAISVTSSNVTGTKGYGNLTYDSSTGVITYTRVSNADIKSALAAGTGIALDANGLITATLTGYSDSTARGAISSTNSNVAGTKGYGNLAYDSSTGVMTYTRVSNADIKNALSAGSGIALDANGMITATLTGYSDATARGAISTTNSNVAGTKGYGNLAYNSSTGVITYTRVSNVDIKDALSAGTGITIAANGMISTAATAYGDSNARAAISVTTSTPTGKIGYGNIAYDNGTGIITLTKVSNSDVVGALSAGSGVALDANGRITVTSSIGTGTNLQINSLGVGTAGSGLAGEIRATNDITAFYSSDRNLKTNIHVITNALVKLEDISGVSFDWNDTALAMYPDRTYNDIGVIAQEIEAVLPQVVTTRDTGYKAVKYEKIIPLLIQAIKELKSEVDTLKQQINTK